MPFWEQCKCCRNCRFWRQGDPSNLTGLCTWGLTEAPFWYEATLSSRHGNNTTSHDEGKTCPVYRHQANKPHPLDNARAYLAQAQVGDKITLRTYDIGAVSRTEADVLSHSQRFVTVRMFNDIKRVRLDATTSRFRGGTVVGMEDWGVDLAAPIIKGPVRTEHPERAEQMLAKVRAGDRVPVIGYPPMDGIRKSLFVSGSTKNILYLAYGRRRLLMHRTGPLAGIIEGDVWALDTTEEQGNAAV